METKRPLLQIAILDKDKGSAEILATVLKRHANVLTITILESIEETDKAFQERTCNSLVIDIYGFEPTIGVDFISKVRKAYPTAPICLYSTSSELASLPGLGNYWRKRLGHFYKVPKDLSMQVFAAATSNAVDALSTYLEASLARYQLKELQNQLSNTAGFSQETRQGAIVTIAKAENALAKQTDGSLKLEIIVPGLDVAYVQSLITDTLIEIKKTLQLTRSVNTGVLILGAIVVLASLANALYTGQQVSVVFGALGIASVVAALITSPLKSLSATASKIVQTQAAYFVLLNQLRLLGNASDTLTDADRSKRLSEVMQETIRILNDQKN